MRSTQKQLRLYKARRSDSSRRGVAAAILAVTFGLLGWGCQVTGHQAAVGSGYLGSSPRRLVDCPDDSDKPQIHLLYAIPSDADDLELDKNGLIRDSVASAQSWFSGESGGSRLRFDTCQGELDITFVQLPRRESEYFAFGANVRDQVEYDLWSAAFSAPNKLYAAYYGGRLVRCGQGPQPPKLPGNVVVLEVGGRDGGKPAKGSGCGEPFTVGAQPGRWEFALVHEIFHALGAVASQAPNELDGHVNDHLHDLMSGPEWRFPSRLDVGRDDYWNHSDPDLVDVSESAFLESTPPGAAMPVPWPLHPIETLSTSPEPSLSSPSSSVEVTLEIVNRSSREIGLHWIDHAGAREGWPGIPVNDSVRLKTFAGHFWVVTDHQGKALAIYRAPDSGWGRAVHSNR